MSYPRDLDELSEEELVAELSRRGRCRNSGLCDYCGRKLGIAPACRFPERHRPSVTTDESKAEILRRAAIMRGFVRDTTKEITGE